MSTQNTWPCGVNSLLSSIRFKIRKKFKMLKLRTSTTNYAQKKIKLLELSLAKNTTISLVEQT